MSSRSLPPPDWTSVSPLWLQALGKHLLPRDLANARLACKVWAFHLASAAGRIRLWPAMLRRQRGTRSSMRLQPDCFLPRMLLSGLDPKCEVMVMISDLRQPSAQQLQQLWSLLVDSHVQIVTIHMVNEGYGLPPAEEDAMFDLLFTTLKAQPSLTQRLERLTAHLGVPTTLSLSASAFASLKALHCDPTAAQLSVVAQLTTLEELCIVAEGADYLSLNLQEVLHMLQPLRQMQSLVLDGDLKHHGEVVCLPDFARLTSLHLAGECKKELQVQVPAGLASRIQDMEGGALVVAGAAELSALTRVLMPKEQLAAGMPALPSLLVLDVEGDVSYAQLQELLGGLPTLQDLNLAKVDHSDMMEAVFDAVQEDNAWAEEDERLAAASEQYMGAWVSLLQQLPQLCPGLTSLSSPGGDMLPEVDELMPVDNNLAMASALAHLRGLRGLELLDHWHFYLNDSSLLAGLPQLESFDGGIRHLDVAHLPPSLTRLHAVVLTVSDSAAEARKRQARSSRARRRGSQEQPQPQHAYPHLLHLDLKDEPYWLQDQPEPSEKDRAALLAPLEPVLQQAQHLGLYCLMASPYHKRNLRIRSQEVLAGLTGLQELVLNTAWQGMDKQLAGLTGLTSLSFHTRLEWQPPHVLEAVQKLAVTLPRLKRLAGKFYDSWPREMTSALRAANPGLYVEVCEDREMLFQGYM